MNKSRYLRTACSFAYGYYMCLPVFWRFNWREIDGTNYVARGLN